MSARRVKALVAYDGTGYHGFEWQMDLPTIQGEIEKALWKVTQERMRIVGAGRTDAGVHATGQVISFDTPWSGSPATLENALNANLPQAIVVREAVEVAPEFHARRSAQSRRYRYTIYNHPRRDPLLRLYSYHWPRTLDKQAMNEALEMIRGEHDFATFGTSPSGKSTVRQVYDVQCTQAEEYLHIEVEANAFLRHMMRRLVASLLSIGQGEITLEDFGKMLEARDQNLVKGMAPAHGLCLTGVTYPA